MVANHVIPSETFEEPERTPTHVGRRFDGVAPSAAADAELTWLFNVAPMAVDVPSVQGQLLVRRHPGRPDAMLRRAEALHAARKILARLSTLAADDVRVLDALYTDRVSPRATVRRLGHRAAVVACLPVVRAGFEREAKDGRTRAADAVAWLEERCAGRSEALHAWQKLADVASGRALRAYELARGDGYSVVPEEER